MKVSDLPDRQGYEVILPSSPELEAWLEAHHDPNWKPRRRLKRNTKGRFTR